MLFALLRRHKNQTDEELISEFRVSQDNYYVGLLFKRYNEMTASLSYNYLKNEEDAKDAVMECYELLYKELKNPKLEIKNFGGWYYSVVRNELLKLKRLKEKNKKEQLIEGYHDRSEEDLGLSELFNDSDNKLKDLVEEVLATLKPEQIKCVKAFFMEGKSYKEIIEEFNLSEKEVKSHIQNGKRKLLIELERRDVKSVNEIL